jgi:hypothetical protein
VIDESDLQTLKQFDPRIWTVLGINIDWSDEFENASDSIRVNREFNSNTIDLSGSGSSLKSNGLFVRWQFRMMIEFGIQTRRILELLSARCATGFIEPSFTTTRRS